MIDTSKFEFVFDCHRGFGADNTQVVFNVFDGPAATDSSYTQLLAENYNTIEATLDEYRAELNE